MYQKGNNKYLVLLKLKQRGRQKKELLEKVKNIGKS